MKMTLLAILLGWLLAVPVRADQSNQILVVDGSTSSNATSSSGISTNRPDALGVGGNPFAAYDKQIITRVQNRWNALVYRFGAYEKRGKVTIEFQLLNNGNVETVKITENTVGKVLSLFCVKAVRESAPFNPLPGDLRAQVGKEPREVTFTFYY